jgi:death-on-curing protein
MGETLSKDPLEIAGAHLFFLCRNRPFVDGNKRTALATCLVFLSENGPLPDERLGADAWESLNRRRDEPRRSRGDNRALARSH